MHSERPERDRAAPSGPGLRVRPGSHARPGRRARPALRARSSRAADPAGPAGPVQDVVRGRRHRRRPTPGRAGGLRAATGLVALTLVTLGLVAASGEVPSTSSAAGRGLSGFNRVVAGGTGAGTADHTAGTDAVGAPPGSVSRSGRGALAGYGGSPADPVWPADRGPVSGVLVLRADPALLAIMAADGQPGSAPGEPWVLYLLSGPVNVTRWAMGEPFEASIDTRQLPNGDYTLSEVIFRATHAPLVRTGRVPVANPLPPGVDQTAPGGAAPRSAAAAADPGDGTPRGTPPGPAGSASAGVSGSPTGAGSPSGAEPAAAASTAAGAVAGPAPAPVASGARLAGTPTGAGGGAGSAATAALIEEVVTRTNAQRSVAGCPALAVDARLAASAQEHSADMAARNYFDHSGRDGRSPFDRIAAAGYVFSIAAENIAAGQRTPADVVADWMASPGHRANILNCSLSQIGVGFATGGDYGTYWVQDFGSP